MIGGSKNYHPAPAPRIFVRAKPITPSSLKGFEGYARARELQRNLHISR
jgi:hypothetical protein